MTHKGKLQTLTNFISIAIEVPIIRKLQNISVLNTNLAGHRNLYSSIATFVLWPQVFRDFKVISIFYRDYLQRQLA